MALDTNTPAGVLTLFTAPKPFTHPHTNIIQVNALQSWRYLNGNIQVIVFGDEAGIAAASNDLGFRHIPDISRNENGIPLLHDIFWKAAQFARTPYLGYVNSDIIFASDLAAEVENIGSYFGTFLLVGQRWDLKIDRRLEFSKGWTGDLRSRAIKEGSLHKPTGSDYFIYPRGSFEQIPPFVLGRAGWDNWMLFEARRSHIPIIDATGSIMAIHQQHDYHHLPEGKPHYRLPESEKNIELAGGRSAIFTLGDADWIISDHRPMKKPWLHQGLRRWLETSMTLALGPGRISLWFSTLLHPNRLVALLKSIIRGRPA